MGYSKWFEFVVCIVMLLRVNGFQVPITFVQDAIAKGGGKCFFALFYVMEYFVRWIIVATDSDMSLLMNMSLLIASKPSVFICSFRLFFSQNPK